MNFDFLFYRKLLLRRLPVMLLFILTFSVLGVITAMKLPETWTSSATLLLEEPQIPDEMVASTVRTTASEQLEITQQKLLTRANLIDIANRFRVFTDIAEMNPDDVFREMRAATSIRRSAGRNRATLMTINFDARSGRVAVSVVNELVTLVLAESTSFRVERAENTLNFFDQEVRRLNGQLDTQSSEIATFKSNNANSLPDDQRYRLDRLNLLQERLSQLGRDKDAADLRRQEIVRLYDTTGQVRQQPQNVARSPEEQQLLVARTDLEQARAVYSETHPRVTRLRSLVQRLTPVVDAQIETDGEEEEAPEIKTPEDLIFQATLADLEARSSFIDQEVIRIQAEIERLQAANARSAVNGISLASMERDYTNIQQRYNAALNNLNEAQMSERIETTAQGQRITVVENANQPQAPSGPNRVLIASVGGSIGIMFGVAYFMLLELLNRTIRRPEELRRKFNITPLVVIPYIESRAQRTMRRAMQVSAVLAILIIVPAALWYVDTNYLPLDLIVQRGLQKIGLG